MHPENVRLSVASSLAALTIVASILVPQAQARNGPKSPTGALLATPTPSPTPTPKPSPKPTAAPTAKPTPKPLAQRAAEAEARADSCSGEACRRAELEPIFREAWTADSGAENHAVEKVIPCESSWQRTARGQSGEFGTLQLHPIHRKRWQRMGYTDNDMLHVIPNSKVAQSIWEESGWRPWSCR